MSPILKILLITGFMCIFLAPAFALKFKDCGSHLANITEIAVTGCKDSPCIFHRGTKINISIKFVPKVVIKNATINVWGIINLLKIRFPIANPNGCINSGLTCPLKANVPATYRTQLDIKEEYPKIALIAKWKMVDEQQRSIFCFEIGVKLE